MKNRSLIPKTITNSIIPQRKATVYKKLISFDRKLNETEDPTNLFQPFQATAETISRGFHRESCTRD